MSEITNPQAVRFSNERLHVACDRIISGIRTLRELNAEWSGQNLAPLFAGTQELLDATVADGSATDGRTPLTGYDVNLAASAAQALLTWADGDGAASVAALTKPAVNSTPCY